LYCRKSHSSFLLKLTSLEFRRRLLLSSAFAVLALHTSNREKEPTSFSCLTFPMIPSTCPSFWLSSSLRTASLYWPLSFTHQLSILYSRLSLISDLYGTLSSALQVCIRVFQYLVQSLNSQSHSQHRYNRIHPHNPQGDLDSRCHFGSHRSRRHCSSRKAHSLDLVDGEMSPQIYFEKSAKGRPELLISLGLARGAEGVI
jgi:hypothetical protein